MHLAQSTRYVHPQIVYFAEHKNLIHLNGRVKHKGGVISPDRVTFVRKTDF